MRIVLCLALCCTACVPKIEKRGEEDVEAVFSQIKTGVDTKETVRGKFGPPNTTSFEGTTWYYTSKTIASLAFLKEKITDQRLLMIQFDAQQKVRDVQLTKDTEQKIAFSKDRTQTSGKQESYIKDIFGNFGRFGSEKSEPKPR